MKNNLLNISIIFSILILLFVGKIIIFDNISSRGPNIETLKILKYIPENYELSIISNSEMPEIKKFLKNNLPVKEDENIKTFKDGLFAYLGFDLKGKNIYSIYDGEFVISIFNDKTFKKDLLIIFKTKKGQNLNSVLNLDEDINQINTIKEIKRNEKISYLKYGIQTDDDYLIFSSNKKLLNKSLESKNDLKLKDKRQRVFINVIDKLINEKIVLLFNSRIIDQSLKNIHNINNDLFMSTLDYYNNIINLKFYPTEYSNTIDLSKIISTDQILNEKNIFITSNILDLKEDNNFFKIDNIQSEIYKELIKENNNQIIVITSDLNWIFALPSKGYNEEYIKNLLVLKEFVKDKLSINEEEYTVFYKNRLVNKNDELSLEQEKSLFSYKSDELFFISNNVSLLNNIIKVNLLNKYLDIELDSVNGKFIQNEIISISNFKNYDLISRLPAFKIINYFTSDFLNISITNLRAIFKQKIPEKDPNIFLEAEIRIS